MKAHLEAVTQLYQPNIEAMISHLPEAGESLHTAAVDLSRDFSLERIDRFISMIKGAENNLVHLRKAIVREQTG